MNKLAKRFFIGAMCASISMSVIGCGKSNDSTSSESNTTDYTSITENTEDNSNEKIETSENEVEENDNNIDYDHDEEYWIQFIKDNSKLYNHETTDKVREWTDNEFLLDDPSLDVLNGSEDSWHITDTDNKLDETIKAGRTFEPPFDSVYYNYSNLFSSYLGAYNNTDKDLTMRECIQNGSFFIDNVSMTYNEHSDEYPNELDFVEHCLGDPNEIYVCKTDSYTDVKCGQYVDFDDHSEMDIYYYYIYKYTDRTLIVRMYESYDLDTDKNINKVYYHIDGGCILCPSTFNLKDADILDTIKMD